LLEFEVFLTLGSTLIYRVRSYMTTQREQEMNSFGAITTEGSYSFMQRLHVGAQRHKAFELFLWVGMNIHALAGLRKRTSKACLTAASLP